jgi:GTP diphosphokinase / guanosine-3',5'-bis(diphosphate) 3'-diphosphatase
VPNQDLLAIAEQYAAEAHRTQVRKYRPEPYFKHLRNVALLVAQFKGDENQIAAAWLHDTVEDTATTLQQLEDLFDPDIRKLVEELTDVYKLKTKKAHGFSRGMN